MEKRKPAYDLAAGDVVTEFLLLSFKSKDNE